MRKPTLAIVGRPNVGKSTFFNRIAGKRISIVKDIPGVTRDRVIVDAEWCGKDFVMIDTGGIDLKSDDEMQKHIMYQAQLAIDVADTIIFMVDGKAGVVQGDYEVATLLRKTNKPVLLVVNKIDNNEIDNLYDFYKLGMGDPIAISSEQAKGLGDLLDAVIESFKFEKPTDLDGNEEQPLKIAFVGKPNVGKSSLTNRLLGEDRVVVSNVAGTTRDSIDTPFKWHGKDYVLIDTAGLRRKSAVEYESVEYYSTIRTIDAIRRADVVCIVFDASEELSEQDIRIAGMVHEEGKPSLVLYNKWDKIEKDDRTILKYKRNMDEKLKFMDYYFPLFISALEGKRLSEIMPSILQVYDNAQRRLTTGVLNDIIFNATAVTPPPSKNGKRLKIKYATQASINPPTFILFVNDKELLHYSYERFLENKLREAVDFRGTPIKIIARENNEELF